MPSYRILSLLMFGFAVSTAACFDDSTGDTSSAVGNGGANGNVRGAIFTTTVDGSRVNANIYAAKTDVYLDGGPSGNAPSSAAALPEGDYLFQVTDPSGKTLLSTDDISCRRIHINADGVIDQVYAGVGCQHAQGVDQDHAALGAITVQLFPYLDTPNNGGEYKVWVTPVDAYDLGGHGGNSHGFVRSKSKTDNFKIKIPGTPEAPTCGDGSVDTGEDCDDGNSTNDDGCSSTCSHEEQEPPHPACGDGHLDAGEQCDDGNVGSGDGCSYVCTIETPPPPAPCCGDGHLDAGEQCDDGNTVGGDGCSATCTIEPPPPPPAACCGDGHLDAGEDCDDGNTTGGDGCSSTCHDEDLNGTGERSAACTTCAGPMTRY